jgi:nucleotide-binding universal stress UspA family protein
MKRILVPSDFSSAAENALAVATQIAQQAGVEVVLLHLIDPEKFYTTSSDGDFHNASQDINYQNHLREIAEGKLKELISQFSASAITPKVEMGKIPQAIAKFIEDEAIGLVVMATHTSTAIEDLIFGSNTEKVIRTAPCPVLTLREKVKNFQVKNIVLASSFAEDQTRGMAKVQALQQAFGAKLHLAYINTPADFLNNRRIYERKEVFLSKFPFENTTFTIYNDYTVETGIANFAEDTQADLIILSAHHWEDYNEFTDTSHTSDVIISRVKCPVMTF